MEDAKSVDLTKGSAVRRKYRSNSFFLDGHFFSSASSSAVFLRDFIRPIYEYMGPSAFHETYAEIVINGQLAEALYQVVNKIKLPGLEAAQGALQEIMDNKLIADNFVVKNYKLNLLLFEKVLPIIAARSSEVKTDNSKTISDLRFAIDAGKYQHQAILGKSVSSDRMMDLHRRIDSTILVLENIQLNPMLIDNLTKLRLIKSELADSLLNGKEYDHHYELVRSISNSINTNVREEIVELLKHMHSERTLLYQEVTKLSLKIHHTSSPTEKDHLELEKNRERLETVDGCITQLRQLLQNYQRSGGKLNISTAYCTIKETVQGPAVMMLEADVSSGKGGSRMGLGGERKS